MKMWDRLNRHRLMHQIQLEMGYDPETARLTADVFAMKMIVAFIKAQNEPKRIYYIASPKSIADALLVSALYLLGYRDRIPEYIEGFPLIVGKAVGVALKIDPDERATVLNRAVEFGVEELAEALVGGD